MRKNQLRKEIEMAIELIGNLAHEGWTMLFGEEMVSNIDEALKSGNEEAIAYWQDVQDAAEDSADFGKQALGALETGDMEEVRDLVHRASSEEMQFGDDPIWYDAREMVDAISHSGNPRKYFVVAVSDNHLADQYAPKHVMGYTTWNVTVDVRSSTVVSIRLRAVNVDAPSKKALTNYTLLREHGLI